MTIFYKENNMSEEGANPETEAVESTDTNDTMTVDLGGGVSAELPVESAKKYIAWKDERTASFNELKTKFDNVSKTANELSEKTKLMESMKQSQYEEVKAEIETRIKGEYEGKITELNNKLVGTAVDVAISNAEGVVEDKAARQDLKALFISTNTDLTDDVTEISNKLQEFIKEKPHFHRANTEKAKPPVNKSKVSGPTPSQSYDDALKEVFRL